MPTHRKNTRIKNEKKRKFGISLYFEIHLKWTGSWLSCVFSFLLLWHFSYASTLDSFRLHLPYSILNRGPVRVRKLCPHHLLRVEAFGERGFWLSYCCRHHDRLRLRHRPPLRPSTMLRSFVNSFVSFVSTPNEIHFILERIFLFLSFCSWFLISFLKQYSIFVCLEAFAFYSLRPSFERVWVCAMCIAVPKTILHRMFLFSFGLLMPLLLPEAFTKCTNGKRSHHTQRQWTNERNGEMAWIHRAHGRNCERRWRY